jgi:hypothetical protein
MLQQIQGLVQISDSHGLFVGHQNGYNPTHDGDHFSR